MMMKVMSVVSQSWTVQCIFCVTHVHSTKGAMNFTTDSRTLPSVTLHVSNPFANRMQMASIMPHDRIAIAVSGGPDSMALCILTARWWQQQQQVKRVSHGVIEEAAGGMMLLLLSNHVVGMVVDHGLHPENVMEALSVQHWLARLGEFFLLLDPELFPSLCCTLFFFFFIFFHTSSSSLAHTFCKLRLQQTSGPLDNVLFC